MKKIFSRLSPVKFTLKNLGKQFIPENIKGFVTFKGYYFINEYDDAFQYLWQVEDYDLYEMIYIYLKKKDPTVELQINQYISKVWGPNVKVSRYLLSGKFDGQIQLLINLEL